MILCVYLLHKEMFVRIYCSVISTKYLMFCIQHYAQLSQTLLNFSLRHTITAAT